MRRLAMGLVPKETIERLFVLSIIERFDEGVYGHLRLQKVAYFAVKDVDQKPLTFAAYDHGEYSPRIPVILEQLASMGYISAYPLDTGDHGNQYHPTQRAMFDYHSMMLGRFSRDLREATDRTIDKYGYLPEPKLVELAKADQLYLDTHYGQPIFRSNLADMVEISGVSDDDADELALSLDPRFISAARLIVRGLEQADIDFDKVRKVASLL